MYLFYFNEIPTLILAYQSFEYKSVYNSVKYLAFTSYHDKNLDFLSFFINLESLVLTNVYKKKNLNEIGELVNLKYLKLSNIFVKNFSFIEHLINLEKIIIKICHLNSISGIENCKKLKELDISRCYYLKNVSEIQHLVNLEKLSFYNYWSTFDVSWLLNMKNLINLEVSFYSCMLNNYLFLELTNLKRLHLSDIVFYHNDKHHVKNRKPIKDFSKISNLKNLEYLLIMEDAKFIKHPISQLKTLKELNYFDKKSNFNFISNLEKLKRIYIKSSKNQNIDKLISSISKINRIKVISFNNVTINDLSPLLTLQYLEDLEFRDCIKLSNHSLFKC